jgi:hypothetical protein
MSNLLRSETKEICPYRIYRDCRKIIFVDTPGFSDADMEDAKILAIFATWLSAYKNIAGMIWLQPIDDTKFDRQSARNQKLFEAITGERNLPIVSLVTTKWSNAHGSRAVIGTYKKRESELKERWTHLLNKKAQVLRDDNEDLLNLVLNHSKGESLLALQQELVTNKYSLAQTASGRILSDEFRTDRLEEEIIKMLDQILIDRKNGTPNYLLVSDAQRAYDSYVEKREAQRLLDEWTFDKMVGPWVGIPAAGVGAGTFGIIGLVALDEGLSIGLAIGGTTLTAVAALATAGVAVAVVGGALLYQHVTRKPLPVGDAKFFELMRLLTRITGNRTGCESPGMPGPTVANAKRTSSQHQHEPVRCIREDNRRPLKRPFNKTCAVRETSTRTGTRAFPAFRGQSMLRKLKGPVCQG